MANRNLVITLEYKGGGVFCATVDVPRQGVERTDTIKWRVRQPEPPEFPEDAVVSVDFRPDRDCLIDGDRGHHRGGRNGNDHAVKARVGFVPNGSYSYVISWVNALGSITPMKDPELVVEGGPGNPPSGGKKKKKATKRSAVTRRNAGKKSAKKKPAQIAKKAKKAKRSPKRKAKKR
jgi:hypothetical protein